MSETIRQHINFVEAAQSKPDFGRAERRIEEYIHYDRSHAFLSEKDIRSSIKALAAVMQDIRDVFAEKDESLARRKATIRAELLDHWKRHISAIVKTRGMDAQIIWAAGGKRTEIHFEFADFLQRMCQVYADFGLESAEEKILHDRRADILRRLHHDKAEKRARAHEESEILRQMKKSS